MFMCVSLCPSLSLCVSLSARVGDAENGMGIRQRGRGHYTPQRKKRREGSKRGDGCAVDMGAVVRARLCPSLFGRTILVSPFPAPNLTEVCHTPRMCM